MPQFNTELCFRHISSSILPTVKGRNRRKRVARRQIGGEACVEEPPVQRSPRVTVSALPDDALLEIFKFYVDQIHDEDAWHTLVHVCRKWRYIVFASPRSLHLELRCTKRRPVKKMLDIWPVLRIVIDAYITNPRRSGVRNLISAFKRHDLVYSIKISGVPHSLLKSPVMKKRFPKLTNLTLQSLANEDQAPVIPDSFLSGSAPRLQSLYFSSIQFPSAALGKLLLSATDLVFCHLGDIPKFGIISPDLIVTALSTGTRLQTLFIGFRSPRPRADREHQHLSPLKRLVLPSLTNFFFTGDSEYLEDIVGRIDTPALHLVKITFFNQLVFDTPLLRDFFSGTEVFRELHRADVIAATYIRVELFRLEEMVEHCVLHLTILSGVLEWQVSSLAQFCSSSFPPFPTLRHLKIMVDSYTRTEDMESSQWLELLHPFVAVRDLVLPLLFRASSQIATALGELTENTATEVLPALQRVLTYPDDRESFREALAQFITTRGHSVSVHPW